jgi:hypothetical protein
VYLSLDLAGHGAGYVAASPRRAWYSISYQGGLEVSGVQSLPQVSSNPERSWCRIRYRNNTEDGAWCDVELGLPVQPDILETLPILPSSPSFCCRP